MADDWDVIVAGGGVAGCAAGRLLANGGLKVLILEKGHHPRHHIGESLLPASMPILADLGISREQMALSHQPKYGARFADPISGHVETFEFAGCGGYPPAYQVLRSVFDEQIKTLAIAGGCDVREGVGVTQWETSADAVNVRTTDQRVHGARFFVDASGRARLDGPHAPARQINNRFGHLAIYNYYRQLPAGEPDERSYITVHLIDNGWIWFIPLKDEITGVGVVLTREGIQPGIGCEALFEFAARQQPALWERLRDAGPMGEYRTASDYSYRSERRFGSRWAKVGDAGGFLDPIFSSGVHLALSSAHMAAGAIQAWLISGSEELFAQYAAMMHWAEEIFEAFIERFYHRELIRGLFFAPHKPPAMRDAITNLLSGYVWNMNNPMISMLGAKLDRPLWAPGIAIA